MILHHSLTATSACKISAKMLFNKSVNITFKWCMNNLFLETLFFFFYLRLFSLSTWFLSLFSLSFLGLESFGSFHLVFEFLVVSYSLTAWCEWWLPCEKLSFHYENIDNVYIWRKMHEKMKDKKENMEIT